jgi:hypothetical protein
MACDDLGADSALRNDNIVAFPTLRPGVPPFDPANPRHIQFWNSIWEQIEAAATRIREAYQAPPSTKEKLAIRTAYLVEMPKSWEDAVAQCDAFEQIWHDLGDDYSNEYAEEVGDAHDRALFALAHTPVPDAAALAVKIRMLAEQDRIDRIDDNVECLIADCERLAKPDELIPIAKHFGLRMP